MTTNTTETLDLAGLISLLIFYGPFVVVTVLIYFASKAKSRTPKIVLTAAVIICFLFAAALMVAIYVGAWNSG